MTCSSIHVGGIGHKSPIPNASRIGNIIASGLIRGADPSSSRPSDTLQQQCALMFSNLRKTIEAGGERSTTSSK